MLSTKYTIALFLTALSLASISHSLQFNSTLPTHSQDDPVSFLQANINLSCDVCKFVVYEVEQYLLQHEPMIEKKLVQLCSYLPLQFEQICDTIVLVYGHTIIKLLEKYETPSAVCEEQLRLCPVEESQEQEEKIPKSNDRKDTILASDDFECTLCELMVSMIEHFIESKKSQREIMQFLNAACLRLPSSVSLTCTNLVRQYVPQIIDKIEKKFPPHRVCKEFVPLCRMDSSIAPLGLAAPEFNSCTICRTVMTQLDQQLMDRGDTWADIHKINQILRHHACKHVPETYHKECKHWVSLLNINQLKERHFLRQDQCQKECKKGDNNLPDNNQFPLLCYSCKYLVSVLNNFITKKSTQREIVRALSQTCELFPSSYKEICAELVKKYGSAIVKIMATLIFSPPQVCGAIHCCGWVAQSPSLPLEISS